MALRTSEALVRNPRVMPTLESTNRDRPSSEPEERFLELLRFLILGSRGGTNRGRILNALLSSPRHAFDVAKDLHLNYGTVTAHLRTLEEAGVIVRLTVGRYARGYALAPVVRTNVAFLERLLDGPGPRG